MVRRLSEDDSGGRAPDVVPDTPVRSLPVLTAPSELRRSCHEDTSEGALEWLVAPPLLLGREYRDCGPTGERNARG